MPLDFSDIPDQDTEEHGNALDPYTTMRAMMAYNGLTQRGMDPDVALGYAANFVQESRADPYTRPGDAGASHGMPMWNGSRLAAFRARYGHDPEQGGLDEQLDHIMWENEGPEAENYRKVLLTPGGAVGKAAAVSQYWERPKDTVSEINRRSWIARQLIPSAMAAELQRPKQGGALSFDDVPDAGPATPAQGGALSFDDVPDVAKPTDEAKTSDDKKYPGFHYDPAARQMVMNGAEPLKYDEASPKNHEDAPEPAPATGDQKAALETMTEYGQPATTEAPAPEDHPTNAGERAYQAAKQAWQETPALLDPKAQEVLDNVQRAGGVRGYLAALGSTAAMDLDYLNKATVAAFRGGQEFASAALAKIPFIGEQGARDIAAIPEAFMGTPHPTGIPSLPRLTAPEAAAMREARDLSRAPLTVGPETGLGAGERTPGQAEHEDFANLRQRMNENWPAEGQPAAPLALAAPELARETPPEPAVTPSTPEPASDIAAQIDAMHDPDNPKDAVFVAAGNESAIPRKLPKGTLAIHDPAGTLLTTNPDKLRAFADGPVTDELLAKLLGYPETKADAIGSGEPVVVQGKTPGGDVVAATATSPERAPEAVQAIGAQTPEGGQVETVSPVEAQRERQAKVAGEAVSGSYVMFDPRDLTLDPKTFQYKQADEQGVTGALRGVTRWEPALANPITVWQGDDGRNYVVNGHQRTDLALRAQAAGQDVQMPAQVFREADGYTPEYMRALGAYQNIAEGSGTAIDAAKVLRNTAAIPDTMRLPDLPPRSQLVQQGAGLAKLSDDAFGMVTNEIVPAAYAAHVGNLISDPAEQLGAMQVLARAEPANSEQARLMVQDARDSGFARGTQTGLFGDEDFARSLIPERAKVLDRAMRNIRQVGGVFRAAVEGEESLTSAGNQLNRAGNIQARTENDRLLDALHRHATTRGPISDALNVAAGELASGKPVAGVASRFLTQARAIVRNGQEQGIQPGAGAGRAESAARGVDQAAAYREELPPDLMGLAEAQPVPLFSPVARAVDSLKQQRGTGEQMLAQITNTPGVKPEELNWMGLPGWLRGQKSVTKQQIADYVRANALDVREVARQEDDPKEYAKVRREVEALGINWGDASIDQLAAEHASPDLIDRFDRYVIGNGQQPKFQGYSLPGGVPGTYRELLITLPPKEPEIPPERAKYEQWATARGMHPMSNEANRAYAQIYGPVPSESGVQPLTQLPDGYHLSIDRSQPPDRQWAIIPPGQQHGQPFAGRHATEEAAQAAALERVNEDRAAEAHRSAATARENAKYRSPHWEEPNVLAHVRFDERTAPDGAKVLLLHEIQSDWHQAGRKQGYKLPEDEYQRLAAREQELIGKGRDATDAEKQEWADIRNRLQRQGVPDAPFKTTWPTLVMKRMLKYAADNGFDRVAWAPGEVQADRYDLSKHINRLDYVPSENTIFAYDKNDRIAQTLRDVTPENMGEKIGKEAAEKLLAQPDRPPVTGPIHEGRMWKRLEGADLKIGGEGMKAFYDKMLPNETQKIVGKYGAKVGRSELTVTGGNEQAWRRNSADMLLRAAEHAEEAGANQGVIRHLTSAAERIEGPSTDANALMRGMPEVVKPYIEQAGGWPEIDRAYKQLVHSVDITPAMRRAIQDQGLGLFQRKAPLPPPSGTDLFGATRAAPATRTPEPTIRNDQRQLTLEGTAPSARQAQAAHDARGPRSNQERADQGLFARPETVQPELTPAKPTKSAWIAGVPGLRDMIATLPHGEPHAASRQWVLSRGRQTGHEYLTAVDNHTDQIVHAVTQGQNNGVNLNAAPLMMESARDRYTFHHNHPSENGFSPDDLSIGSLPGTRHIVAHSGPDMFSAAVQTGRGEIALGIRDADAVLRPWLNDQYQAGRISAAQYSRSYYDLQSRILHAMGLIDYTSTRAVPPGIKPEFDALLREKFHVDDPGQYTAAQHIDAALAGLRAPVGKHGQGQGADLRGVSGNVEGRTAGQGRAAPVVQGRLLEPEERAPDQRAAILHARRNGPLPPREMPNLIVEGPPKPAREPRATSEHPEGDLPLPEPPQPDQGATPPPPPMPPDSLWPPDEQPPRPPVPPEIEAARITRPRAVKNLNAVERGTIFPRVLASLDEASAGFWNSWQARERDSTINADRLRKVITPNFLKLGKPERLRVGGALEIARIEGVESLITNPDGTLTYRNMSTPFARWSKVGETVTLTPRETAAYHESVQLGRDQWTMLMKAAAKRYGWSGDIDTEVIRDAANAHGEPSDYKRLNRLADLMDVMRQHEQDIYFPMQRFGSYFIAIRPKEGEAVVANLGGHPPLAWFETVEKPAFQDLLGITKGRLSVQNVAAKRIAELQRQFPPERFDYQQGDFARTPSLLRKIDISAVEKLFMLMENKVKAEVQDQVMRGENPPTTKVGIRAEAANRYEALHGSTLEAFYDALFEELKSGYRRRAKVVPGYSADFDRSISSHLYQIARNSADMVHRDGIQSAYQSIQDFHPHDTVKRYWANWRAYQEDPGSTLSRAADTMSQIGFTYVLGMNPSSTIIMASHTPMAAAPVLSVGVGPRVAIPAVSRGLGRAYAALRFDTVHGGHIDLGKAMTGMPSAKQAFLRLMANEGRLAAVGTHDMAALNDRLAGLFGDKADIARRGMEIATSNVHAVDQANRFAVASAAWDIASDPARFDKAATPLMEHSALFRDMVQREGLSPETYGRFMLSEAAFEWGKQNQPPIQRGPLGRLMFTLHGFQTRYLSTALTLMKNRGPEGRFAALLMLGALGLGAGMSGLPFVEDAENGADALWHHFTGRDPDLKHKLHDAMGDAGFGQIGADMIMRGPLSVALGINLGSRIGFGDVLSREFESSNVLGTIPSIMWSGYTGASQRLASDQNGAAVAAEVVPFVARGPLRAWSAAHQGVVSRKGVPQIAADNLSAADIAKLGAGFTPLKITERQEETSRYIKAQHNQDAWAAMIRSGDRDQAKAAIREMAAAGWGPGRVSGFIRQTRRPPGVGVQFQRFEHQRGVAP